MKKQNQFESKPFLDKITFMSRTSQAAFLL